MCVVSISPLEIPFETGKDERARDSGHRDPDTPQWFHCDLYDPGSYQSYSEITCWGQLPGAPDDMNAVTVSPGAAAAFKHIDVSATETHHMGTGGDIPVGHDQSLTCEIQNPEQSYGDGKLHGFYLSEQGGRVY
jgi:hypothetical protein